MSNEIVRRLVKGAQQQVTEQGFDNADVKTLMVAGWGWEADIISEAVKAGIVEGFAEMRRNDNPGRGWRRQAQSKGPWAAGGAALSGIVYAVVELLRALRG